VPISLTTGIGPNGSETIFVQNPDDGSMSAHGINPLGDLSNLQAVSAGETPSLTPAAYASAQNLLEVLQLAQVQAPAPSIPSAPPATPAPISREPGTGTITPVTQSTARKEKSKTKAKLSVFSAKPKRKSGKQTLESMLESTMKHATNLNFNLQARQLLLDEKKLEVSLFKKGVYTLDQLSEKLVDLDSRMKELASSSTQVVPSAISDTADSDSGSDSASDED
jgi:hypothetical protein